jgi:sec-independent protein translocase protein TatA
MFGLGIPELLIILVIVVVIFGASRLPQIGEGVGRGIKNFRSALREPPEIDVTPSKEDEQEERSPTDRPAQS